MENNYSIADEIRKLKALLDEEIITEEEFQNSKKKLLSTDTSVKVEVESTDEFIDMSETDNRRNDTPIKAEVEPAEEIIVEAKAEEKQDDPSIKAEVESVEEIKSEVDTPIKADDFEEITYEADTNNEQNTSPIKAVVEKDSKMKKYILIGGGVLLAAVILIVGIYTYMHDTLYVHTSRNLYVGDTTYVNVTSEKNRTYTKDELDYSSSYESIATVNENGKITAIKRGSVKITVNGPWGSEGSCMIYASYKPVSVKHGQFIVKPKGSKVAPVKIKTKKGNNYYVYFQNNSNKKNSFAVYIKGGKTLSFKAPYGNYTLYYATGTTWYGKKLLFGDLTSRVKISSKIRFYRSGNIIHGMSFTLYKVKNGNMSGSSVSKDNFPQ